MTNSSNHKIITFVLYSYMFNVHNLIEISHHNDKYCTFYPKNDSSFTHFLDLSDGVQVKGSYL